MKSMTGFGAAESRDEKRAVSVTVKAYNNRFLDLSLNLPADLGALEQKVREHAARQVLRGRVEIFVKFTEYEPEIELRLDRSAVRACVDLLGELAEAAHLEEQIRLSHLLKMEGIFQQEKQRDAESAWLILEPVLDEAFGQLEAMRIREGEATREDIDRLLKDVEKEAEKIAAAASQVEAGVREKLRRRFVELLGDAVDESRILAETAVILMKADVNEELVRMHSHLDKFRQVCRREGAVGKTLDFICQELNREANTIGAKSTIYAVDESVVIIKDALEKIREQVRNVE